MFLDLWSLSVFVRDLLELFAGLLELVSLPFLGVIAAFILISAFAWRSTYIPDLPPVPRPPYVIQISARSSNNSDLFRLANVRLLSGDSGIDVNRVFRGYTQHHHLHHHHHHHPQRPGGESNNNNSSVPSPNPNSTTQRQTSPTPDTNSQSQQGQSLPPSRPHSHSVHSHHHHHHHHHVSPGSILQGLIRPGLGGSGSSSSSSPSSSVLQPIIQRAAAASSASGQVPNVIVYHRVNIYHHHHHHTASSGQASSNSSTSTDQTTSSEQATIPPSVNQAQDTIEVSSHQAIDSSTQYNEADVHLGRDIQVNSHSHTDSDTVNQNQPVDIDRTLGAAQVNHSENPTQEGDPTETDGLRQRHFQTDSAESTMPSPNNTSPSPQSQLSGPDAENIRFTIKFLNDTQMEVTTQAGEKIGDFKRRHFATELADNKTVRLIFNGRVLTDTNSVRESGIFQQCVVHCLTVARPVPTPTSTGGRGPLTRNRGGGALLRDGTTEPGMFFVGFIGVFLIVLWFICFHFGQHLFSQGGVVSLTVLTAIFLVGLLASYLPTHPNQT